MKKIAKRQIDPVACPKAAFRPNKYGTQHPGPFGTTEELHSDIELASY
jgi:hypothetical protein